jgi:hypothetical protein
MRCFKVKLYTHINRLISNASLYPKEISIYTVFAGRLLSIVLNSSPFCFPYRYMRGYTVKRKKLDIRKFGNKNVNCLKVMQRFLNFEANMTRNENSNQAAKNAYVTK